MNQEIISVKASILADKASVWKKYTLPVHITKWNFADPSWQCPDASNDMKPGGKYIARMEAKDGSFGFDFEATYDAIVEGDSFTYTLTDGRKVTTTFKTNGNATEVEVIFDAEKENPAEMQQQGWQAILNNFKKYAES